MWCVHFSATAGAAGVNISFFLAAAGKDAETSTAFRGSSAVAHHVPVSAAVCLPDSLLRDPMPYVMKGSLDREERGGRWWMTRTNQTQPDILRRMRHCRCGCQLTWRRVQAASCKLRVDNWAWEMISQDTAKNKSGLEPASQVMGADQNGSPCGTLCVFVRLATPAPR